MTDPQVALMMLGLFIIIVFLGFPIAFTLMAMGIGFGYYAYFDADRMWRAYNRLEEGAGDWDRWSLWLDGFFNNRIFDLFDDDRTGSININNVRRVAKELGETMNVSELEEMLQRASTNGREITREDFYNIMTKKSF